MRLLSLLQDAIREAGGIPPLVYMLQSENQDDVLQAAGACVRRVLFPHSTLPFP